MGASGMLGSEVAKACKKEGFSTIEISRRSEFTFDATKENFASLSKQLELDETDYVVNCVGWIPQKSSGDERADFESANALNNNFVHQISAAQMEANFRWIQIGTDCVFSSSSSSCDELSPKNAQDVYGKSKILGERYVTNAIFIRCSIIGPDDTSTAGLFSWFKHLPSASRVKGFASVQWNGVSTRAFGRLVVGLVSSNWNSPIHQHWVPRGCLSKFELLNLFKAGLGRLDVEIEEIRSPSSTRVLTTNNEIRNFELWKMAGYTEIPDVSELVQEVLISDLERK